MSEAQQNPIEVAFRDFQLDAADLRAGILIVQCAECYLPISASELEDPDAIYIETAAWVTGPKLQSPVLRVHTGRKAHRTCILKRIDGEAPDQLPIPGLES
jgi:hypothetical protein